MQFDVEASLCEANIANEIDVFSPQGALIHRYSGTGTMRSISTPAPLFKGGSCS